MSTVTLNEVYFDTYAQRNVLNCLSDRMGRWGVRTRTWLSLLLKALSGGAMNSAVLLA